MASYETLRNALWHAAWGIASEGRLTGTVYLKARKAKKRVKVREAILSSAKFWPSNRLAARETLMDLVHKVTKDASYEVECGTISVCMYMLLDRLHIVEYRLIDGERELLRDYIITDWLES